MSTTRPDAALRRRVTRVLALLLTSMLVLGACAAPTPSPSPSLVASLVPTATPEPTPQPTPSFSNIADPELVALIPAELAGVTVQIPPITEFSITPGDIGQVYGDIGARFRSLQLAYVPRPRLSLFAMRMNPPFAATADLEPYLAEAGRYVGIAGLHREAWTLQTIAGHVVWMRPEDNATLAGTQVYTWTVDDLVFLLIGVDEVQNLAMLAGLPGAPPPTPLPSSSASPSLAPSPSAS